MRECEEKLKSVHSVGPRDWISLLARGWQVTKGGTCVKHAGELKSHASWSTTGQNFQFGQAVSSRLKLATRSSCKAKPPDHSVCYKPDFLHSKHTPVLIPLIPTYCGELLERILREKP